MKHSSHINIYRSVEISIKQQQTTTREVDNGVRQSRLRLWAFVSVGEAFLFMFKDLKIHHNSAKRIKK
jgi:hypothetical protein